MAEKISIEIMSGFWFCGWLFTWGYLQLSGLKILAAIIIWAYYLGQSLGGIC
jgi:hypothetical protein